MKTKIASALMTFQLVRHLGMKKALDDFDCTRRTFLRHLTSACGVGLLASREALGHQDKVRCRDHFDGETIRFIVPQPVGGGYDAYARLIAPVLGKKLGASVVVENIVGAAGIVGANVLKEAPADGMTVGILNMAGLLVSSLRDDPQAPDPRTDFTVLGHATRSSQVWAVGSSSGWKTIEDVVQAAQRRPLLFGIQDVGATSFTAISVSTQLMGVDWDFVSGYRGTMAACLAVVRGEVDLVVFTFESIRPRIEDGDLVPVLQLGERLAPHPSLDGVAFLGGESGLAVQRARQRGRDPDEARELARALASLTDLGRVVAAPPGMDQRLFQCLESGLFEALNDPELEAAAAKANWPLHVIRGEEMRTRVRDAAKDAEMLAPIIRAAIQRSQG